MEFFKHLVFVLQKIFLTQIKKIEVVAGAPRQRNILDFKQTWVIPKKTNVVPHSQPAVPQQTGLKLHRALSATYFTGGGPYWGFQHYGFNMWLFNEENKHC